MHISVLFQSPRTARTAHRSCCEIPLCSGFFVTTLLSVHESVILNPPIMICRLVSHFWKAGLQPTKIWSYHMVCFKKFLIAATKSLVAHSQQTICSHRNYSQFCHWAAQWAGAWLCFGFFRHKTGLEYYFSCPRSALSPVKTLQVYTNECAQK